MSLSQLLNIIVILFRFFFCKEHLNVTGHNASSSRIQVYWNPGPLDIQGYSVRYWAEKEGERAAVERDVSKTSQSLLIDGLRPFTVYLIQVTALMTGEEIRGKAKISTDEGGTLFSQINKPIWSQTVSVEST